MLKVNATNNLFVESTTPNASRSSITFQKSQPVSNSAIRKSVVEKQNKMSMAGSGSTAKFETMYFSLSGTK